MSDFPLSLFSAFGIELEYMLVDRETLDIRPIADLVMQLETGEIVSDVEFDDISWSNELVLHVLELKTTAPAPSLAPIASQMQKQIRRVNELAGQLGARLMPTAMHPWMDPLREMKLWPHDYSPVYECFNRIFDCRGHGWANLQSMHINLPFANDEEFGKLHAAVRLVLPLLPALAASSPLMEGRFTGQLDSRLETYRLNSRKIPSIAARVIPEQAFTQEEYHTRIFEPMFREIAPHDPEGILQDEFLNARGAIARFSRGSIEIRVIDLQECPAADLAIARVAVDVLKRLVAEAWTPTEDQRLIEIEPLESVFLNAIVRGEQAVIRDRQLLSQFGISGEAELSLKELWQYLADHPADEGLRPGGEAHAPLQTILQAGPLARRLRESLGATPTRSQLQCVYRELCDCLEAGELWTGP
jgi:gamma-glutamyl:cysteine ligase YbdK (ATP-grasp superfamily)